MTLKDRVLKDAYTPIGTVRLNTPFSTRPGWGKDYADPYAFFGANFDSRAITPTGNANRGLVGLTPALVKKFHVKGTVTGVPSVDKDLDNCQTKLEGARPVCYAALDKKLMTQVVPWVPYLWANYTNVVGDDTAMSPASSHTRPYGRLAQGRVRPRSGRVMGDHRSCCAAMTSTNRPRSRSSIRPCQSVPGARSHGGKLQGISCSPGLPVCAFVSRIGITGSPTVGRRSGC